MRKPYFRTWKPTTDCVENLACNTNAGQLPSAIFGPIIFVINMGMGTTNMFSKCNWLRYKLTPWHSQGAMKYIVSMELVKPSLAASRAIGSLVSLFRRFWSSPAPSIAGDPLHRWLEGWLQYGKSHQVFLQLFWSIFSRQSIKQLILQLLWRRFQKSSVVTGPQKKCSQNLKGY